MCGGSRIGDEGYFVENTIFTEVTDDMRILKEEVQCLISAFIYLQ